MLIENVGVSVAAPFVSGAVTRYGNVLDMKDFDGVLVIVQIDTVAAGAAASIHLQGGEQADGSDMADLAGTSMPIAAGDDGEIRALNLHQSRSRFIRLAIVKDSTNAVSESACYVQSDNKEGPVAQDATVVTKMVASPDYGTP